MHLPSRLLARGFGHALLGLALATLSSCTLPRAPGGGAKSAESYDFVILHAHVFGYPNAPADAVAIHRDRIARIGDSDELTRSCDSPCRRIDAGNGFLFPGFHDSHAHLVEAGKAMEELSFQTASIPEIQARLRLYIRQHPGTDWIEGGRWSVMRRQAGNLNAKYLDAVAPVRPVALRDATGHSLWVNSAAMRLAGIARDTPDPVGGTIVRDANGDPTGVLLENATKFIYEKIPPPTDQQIRRYVLASQELSMRGGFTAMEGGAVPFTLRQARIYAELDREGLLKQRAFLWGKLDTDDAKFQAMVEFARSLPEAGKVRIVAFKAFLDGVLSQSTAAMLEPYSDDPGNRGLLKLSQADLNRFVLRANRAGFPAALHASGDRAVRMALDAFVYSERELGRHDLKNRVEHASVVDPADIPRFAQLGAVASMQPGFLDFRNRSAFFLAESLGERRLAHLYAWHEIQNAGALLIFGTDFPESSHLAPDAITELHCAITREFRDGFKFHPEQSLAPDAAILAFTVNPYLALGLGDRFGKVAPGFEADLVLFDKDPRSGNVRSVEDDPVRLLMIGGVPQFPGSR